MTAHDERDAKSPEYLAGFRAGQVAALTDAAADYSNLLNPTVWIDAADWLRARAADLGGAA